MIRRRQVYYTYYIQQKKWWGWKNIHRTLFKQEHEETWEFMLNSGLQEIKTKT